MSIRVLVADDSRTVRQALVRLLGNDARLSVIGQATDGVEALALAKSLRPDVVTMDVRMPNLDGLEATAAIMATTPSRILLVCTVSEDEQQDLSFRAMDAGALEVIAKPTAIDAASFERWGRHVADSIALMAEVPVVTRRRGPSPSRPPAPRSPVPLPPSQSSQVRPFPRGDTGPLPPPPSRIPRPAAVALVASTGGPPALAQVLAELPRDLAFPLLLAQHMAPGFVSGLARWLGSVGPIEVGVATDGLTPLPGRGYLAPDGCDLVVDRSGQLRTPPSPGGVCPSADRLLASMAATWGPRAATVILTGMGEDGTAGLRELRRAGGVGWAQDQATSVVYGMPRAAMESGASLGSVALGQVSTLIRELSQGSTPEAP